jgi:hypothetical protein
VRIFEISRNNWAVTERDEIALASLKLVSIAVQNEDVSYHR